jgi:hypothetical protein
MDTGEVDMKERISMVGKEYAVLKEDMKLDECGWSNVENYELADVTTLEKAQ